MAQWQPSKSDMSPRKGYIPEIPQDRSNDSSRRHESFKERCRECGINITGRDADHLESNVILHENAHDQNRSWEEENPR